MFFIHRTFRRWPGLGRISDMLSFLLLFFLYALALIAEQAVVNLSPHDVERLRTAEGEKAQRAYRLASEVRPVLAALLLARVLLLVLLAVSGVMWLLQSEALSAALASIALPAGLSWVLAVVVLAMVFAAVCKGLQRLRVSPERSVFWLKILGVYVAFWRNLFSVLVRNEKSPEPLMTVLNGNGENAPSTSNDKKGSQQETGKRDIELLKSIIKFGDVTVKQVMQPRSKVTAVDFRTDFKGLLAAVRESGFSRLPVYDQDLDNLTGILYVKDLVPHLDKNAKFEWQSLIRTNVLMVPESKRVSELLAEFKARRRHMAIVVDEYGGSSGVVTMEDVLEEVTGEIQDEFDDEESLIRYRKLDDYNYIFEGQTLLNDVYRLTGLDSETFESVRGDADTLAGLALELRGDIPKNGTEIPWNGYLLTVLAANSRRIEQLKLTLPK